jgi:hypothetical protein
MVVMPELTPVTTTGEPLEARVATDVLLLTHVPPAVASLNDVVAPLHIPAVPRIAVIGLTVNTVVVLHPVAVTR